MVYKENKDNKKRRPYTGLPSWVLAMAVAALVVIAVSTFAEASNRPLRYYAGDGGTAMTFYTNSTGDQNMSRWGINTDDPLCELDINGSICINRTGYYLNGVALGGGAPATAQYVTLALDGTLTNERVLTPGKGITVTDTGANGVARINITGLEDCSAGQSSQWNGTEWNCVTGGSGDNNYTTGLSTTRSGNNQVFDLSRSGMSNLSAFFTFQSSTGILVNNGVFYANATNCSSGQYSRYENNGWNCYNDASGGSGTVTSVALNSTTTAVSITGSPVIAAGTLVFEIRNATTLVDGLMTSVQATSLSLKALASNCVGDNATHINVSVNVTTAGVQCYPVSKNPGGGSGFVYSDYFDQVLNQSSNVEFGNVLPDANNTYDLGSTTRYWRDLYVSNGTIHLGPSIDITGDATNIYSNGVALMLVNDQRYNDTVVIGALYTNVTALQVFRDGVYVNVTALQAFRDAVYLNVTALQTNSGAYYQNITDLQNSNASTNTRVSSVNSTMLGFVLQLGQNDTNLNASINVVNTRVTTTNDSLQLSLVNITNLQSSNTSTNTRINTLNTTIQNLLTTNGTIFSLIDGLYSNTTLLQAFRDAIYVNVTALQANSGAYYQNITDLQNSNTSTNTRINTINTTVQNLLSSNGSIYTRIDTVNTTVQNLLSSNTSINTRVDTVNTTVQNLLSSNTSTNTRVDTLNTSISTLSTFAQTKSETGYSGDCQTGVAGFTMNNGSAPNVTCAPAQSGGSGMTTFGIATLGTNASMSNSSTFYLYPGSGITINMSTTTPYPGATITASAGGGNLSVFSNGTVGYIPRFNSSTMVNNSPIYCTAAGTCTSEGNFYASTIGATEGSPRIVGINGLDVSQAARFQFADDSNAIHTAYSASMTWYGYWGLVIRGNRQSVGAPGYDYITNRALTIIGDTNITSTLYAPEFESTVKNITSILNSTNNNSLRVNTIDAGINRQLFSAMTQKANYFGEIDMTLTPGYKWFPGAGSSTTVPIQMGVAAGTAAAGVGTIANVNNAWGGAMYGCSTGTTYKGSCANRKATLEYYRLGGFYQTGSYFLVTTPGTDSTGSNHFVGMNNGANASSITWAENYTTAASAVGFMVNTNTTNGLGIAWHFYSSNAATHTAVSTTINATLGHNYIYGIYCPPSSTATTCYGWLKDTNVTETQGSGEWIGEISTNLPAATTAMAPGFSYTQKQATTRTSYVKGFAAYSFNWVY